MDDSIVALTNTVKIQPAHKLLRPSSRNFAWNAWFRGLSYPCFVRQSSAYAMMDACLRGSLGR
jgi:hypothetical protein